MLTIRQHQWDCLATEHRERLIMRAQEYLVEHFPEILDRTQSKDEIHQFLRAGCAQAAAHGIDVERLVVRYLLFAAIFGLDFDTGQRCPEIRTILCDNALLQETKMLQIERVLSDSLNRRQGPD